MKKILKSLFFLFSFSVVVLAAAVILLPPNMSPVSTIISVLKPREAAFGEKKSLNILLLGVDYNYDGKGQRYTAGARSDTILLIRLEPLGKQLSMMSVPRDLLVGIGANSTYGYDKINSAFSIGGHKLAQETVARVTGLNVDHFVVVKSDVVADLVDEIGGVPILVDKQMDWDDNWAGLHIHLKPGQQRLSGEDAVGYCRFRQDEEGDFGRMKRQQHFLEALFKELKQAKHWPKYKRLADIMAEKLTTDLSQEQMVGLATIYRDFPVGNIRKGRPEVEDYISEGVAYLVLAPGEPAATVKEVFPALPDPSVAGLPVLILTSPRFGIEAKRVAYLLKTRGFGTVRIKTVSEESSSTTSTLVLSSPDGKGAKVLRNMFPELVLTKKQEKGRPRATLTIRSEVYVSDDTLFLEAN